MVKEQQIYQQLHIDTDIHNIILHDNNTYGSVHYKFNVICQHEMEELHRQLRQYLEDLAASHVRIHPASRETDGLPIFLLSRYDVYRTHLFGHSYLLMLLKSGKRPTPAQVQEHAEITRRLLGENVAFVFNELKAYDRKRLIQRGVPFIVPYRQTFLPMVLIDLRSRSTVGMRTIGKTYQDLSAPAQALLLFHLQKPDVDDLELGQWAVRLGYSPTTLTRVRGELIGKELCKAQKRGRSTRLVFTRDRHELWQKALPSMQSPVRGRSHVRIHDCDEQLLLDAGLTALSRSSSIAAPHNRVVAMSSSGFRKALRDRRLELEPYEMEDTIVIERWRYSPIILSDDGLAVDRISLYLSLRDDPDERVQSALTHILGSMTWL